MNKDLLFEYLGREDKVNFDKRFLYEKTCVAYVIYKLLKFKNIVYFYFILFFLDSFHVLTKIRLPLCLCIKLYVKS